jgi:hypothetical protein
MGIGKDIYDVGSDAVEARFPFRLSLAFKGYAPTIVVGITNHTREAVLYVNSVRIHYGQTDYNYCFYLEPATAQTIHAKETKEFILSPLQPITIGHIQIVEKLPAPDSRYPSFESPVDLFRAIMNGNAKDSWLEIDFNEFKNRIFRRGELKDFFQAAFNFGKEHREKIAKGL